MAIPRNLANLAPKLSATGGSFATTIGVGAATPAASGAGITFPADQTIIGASSDANTLDDYEEGTFTPELTGSSSAGTTTYTGQNGTYTKIGRLVTITLNLNYSATTATGDLRITGLPFAIAGTYYPSGACLTDRMNFTVGTQVTAMGNVSTGYLVIYNIGDDVVGGYQQVVNESTEIKVTMSYEI